MEFNLLSINFSRVFLCSFHALKLVQFFFSCYFFFFTFSQFVSFIWRVLVQRVNCRDIACWRMKRFAIANRNVMNMCVSALAPAYIRPSVCVRVEVCVRFWTHFIHNVRESDRQSVWAYFIKRVHWSKTYNSIHCTVHIFRCWLLTK